MNVILLDTNIVSYLFKGDTRVSLYQQHLLGKELAISIMTLAELWQWAEMRNWGDTKRQQLQSTLETIPYSLLTPLSASYGLPYEHIAAVLAYPFHPRTPGSPRLLCVTGYRW